MGNSNKLSKEEGGILIGILALLFGGMVRLYPVTIAGFPINDGGLFTVMIEAIKTNGIKAPPYFQYNGLNIPFAYPPFAFYIGALSSIIFHLRSIDIVRWLPGIVLIGTIPAFYYLSRALLNSSYRAGLATMAFAFTPRTFTWPVMGGGLTRSFGLLFMLLALGNIYRLFKENDRKHLFGSILFSALVVLAHPEAMVHSIAISLLFFIWLGRNKQGILNAFSIVLGTIILTSIWWLPAIIELGLTPFLAAAQTGGQSALSILYPFLLTQTDEPFLTFIAILGLIGFFACLANRNFLLPIWYFVPYLIDPRSGSTYAMIPLTAMAGFALSDVILPGLSWFKSSKGELEPENPLQSTVPIAFLAISGLFMLGGTLYFGNQIAGSTLSEADRTAFNWINTNTPSGSRFLVMTGESQILCDSIQEWFPVLTNRVSLTTIQGNEWLPDHKYIQSIAVQTGVQECMNGTDPLGCIENYHLKLNYIYINSRGNLKNLCRVVAQIPRGEDLISAVRHDSQYQLRYESNGVTIFAFNP